MPKVTYVGNPDMRGEGPDEITMRGESRGFPREGVPFVKGEPADVSQAVADALKGNNHFEIDGAKVPAKAPAKAKPPAPAKPPATPVAD